MDGSKVTCSTILREADDAQATRTQSPTTPPQGNVDQVVVNSSFHPDFFQLPQIARSTP